MVTTRTRSEIPAAAAALYDQIGFKPTGPEQAGILGSRKRFIGVSGGWGAGKSRVASAVWLGRWPDDMASNKGVGDGNGPPLLYWLCGDDYSQTSEEFNYIVRDLEDLGFPVRASGRLDPGYIELKLPDERYPRLRIETKSGQDPGRLGRQRPHGIIICEAGLVSADVYGRLNGRVAATRGWMVLVGTLEGSVGWYPQLLDAWASGYGDSQSFELPTWTNVHLYPGGRQDTEILRMERENSDDFFMERIAGKRVPPRGLVVREFRADLHIREVVFDPNQPLHLWEDPGYGKDSAHALLAVQWVGGQLRVFDEIYERGLTTQEIIRAAQRREWWKVSIKRLVSDPHYKDQHHSTHSVSEIWLSEAGLVAGGERVASGPGIERLRTYFKPDPITGVSGIVIAPHCQGLLSELGAALDPFDNKSFHPWKWREAKDGSVIGDEPLDQYNHACKALIYGIVYNFGYTYAQERRVATVLYRGGQAWQSPKRAERAGHGARR